jgi:dCMP deaminase
MDFSKMPDQTVILPAGMQLTISGPSRPSWDEWALGVAQAVAARADCTRRRIGAVILDEGRRVIATGYNGAPAGTPGCLSAGACPRGRLTHAELPKDSPYVGTDAPCTAIHAEENALLYSNQRERVGATMYVTDAPCPNCRRLIRGSGLAQVVWPGGRLALM